MKETIYEHERGSETFTITAAERWSVSMVRRLKEKRPDEVEIVTENPDGSLVAKMPREWMRIRPKRLSGLTDDQRAAAGQRLSAGRNHKAE